MVRWNRMYSNFGAIDKNPSRNPLSLTIPSKNEMSIIYSWPIKDSRTLDYLCILRYR